MGNEQLKKEAIIKKDIQYRNTSDMIDKPMQGKKRGREIQENYNEMEIDYNDHRDIFEDLEKTVSNNSQIDAENEKDANPVLNINEFSQYEVEDTQVINNSNCQNEQTQKKKKKAQSMQKTFQKYRDQLNSLLTKDDDENYKSVDISEIKTIIHPVNDDLERRNISKF